MTSARITANASQGLSVEGDLTARTVPTLMEELPVEAGVQRLDLAGVGRVDSAGLALLVNWQTRLAAAQGRLELVEVPDGLVRLARISSVDTLLGFHTTDAETTGQ